MTNHDLLARIEWLEKNLERAETERAYWADLAQRRQMELDRIPLAARYPMPRGWVPFRVHA